MTNLEKILGQFEYVAHNPSRMVEEWKKETGGKAVGWLPIHGPEEVIHAAGMLPVGLWGGNVAINKAGEFLQAFCCSVMKAVMELALNGSYRILDAIISPNTCDTMRCIPLMLEYALPHPPVIGLALPDHRKIQVGIEYTASEYKKIAQELMKVGGQEVTDEILTNSIGVYNIHRQTMMNFFDLAEKHLDIITPYVRHMVIKSSFFLPKEKHTVWLNELINELHKLPEYDFKGIKVVVTGIMEEPYELLKIMENYNIAIVSDDLAQGSRQFRTPIPEGNDPFEQLARKFSVFEGCSCVADPLKLRGSMLAEMAKEKQADGVVVLMMKFCDPEEYDYPFMKTDLDDAGIPHVYIESEQQMESLEQARTRLQAFGEMIANR